MEHCVLVPWCYFVMLEHACRRVLWLEPFPLFSCTLDQLLTVTYVAEVHVAVHRQSDVLTPFPSLCRSHSG